MTGFILDTHVLLWANAHPHRLGPETTRVFLDPTSRLAVSSVSAAEIAVKRTIGKLDMTLAVNELLAPIGAEELALTIEQAQSTERLPLMHRDPFDRLLAAQAMTEGLTLITADERLLAYPIATLDART